VTQYSTFSWTACDHG